MRRVGGGGMGWGSIISGGTQISGVVGEGGGILLYISYMGMYPLKGMVLELF